MLNLSNPNRRHWVVMYGHLQVAHLKQRENNLKLPRWCDQFTVTPRMTCQWDHDVTPGPVRSGFYYYFKLLVLGICLYYSVEWFKMNGVCFSSSYFEKQSLDDFYCRLSQEC
jgi:hypothetical protein